MGKKLRFFILMGFVFALSCKTKQSSQVVLAENRLEFGYINQKTGAVNTFVLGQNGMVYQKNVVSGEYMSVAKLIQADAALVQGLANHLKTSNSGLYQISEESLFIRLRNGIDMQEWKWNRNEANLPESYKKFDEILMRMVLGK